MNAVSRGKPPSRTTEEKIALFRARFQGLDCVYGTYDPRTGRAWQCKKPVTDRVVYTHLAGHQPLGVYLLVDDRTRACVVDFDEEDLNPVVALVNRARHYELTMYVERSKRKGFHAWLLFTVPIAAAKGRGIVRFLLEELGEGGVEIFPKQNRIDVERGESGSFINAPLFGALVPQGRTVFLDPVHDFSPYPDQWAFLENARAMNEDVLDEIIEVNGLTIGDDHPTSPRSLGRFEGPSGLPPCARRMLAEGVTQYQRVACFRLAVSLRRIGLDYDASVAVLRDWSLRNRPPDGKRTITDTEIRAQTAHAYLKEYVGYGCEDPAVAPFCHPACPIHALHRADPENSSRIPPLYR